MLCKENGFDGVELHGAHELFLNQISSELTNQRTDRFGGDIDGRLTLAKEIIEGIKKFADDSFFISYRIGAAFDMEDDIKSAQILENAGADILHVSYVTEKINDCYEVTKVNKRKEKWLFRFRMI